MACLRCIPWAGMEKTMEAGFQPLGQQVVLRILIEKCLHTTGSGVILGRRKQRRMLVACWSLTLRNAGGDDGEPAGFEVGQQSYE